MKKRLITKIAIILSIVSLLTVPAFAEIKTVSLHVDGMFCPFCALGLEKKLKKVEAVSTVDVHLKKGVADVTLKPEAAFDLKDFQKAVKKAGFTLKNIDVEVIGNIIRNKDGFLVLQSEGDQTSFILSDQDRAVTQGQLVLVQGVIHKHADQPPGLLIKKLEIIQQ